MKDFPTPADASFSDSGEFMESDKKKKRDPLGAGMLGGEQQLIIKVEESIIQFDTTCVTSPCHNKTNHFLMLTNINMHSSGYLATLWL